MGRWVHQDYGCTKFDQTSLPPTPPFQEGETYSMRHRASSRQYGENSTAVGCRYLHVTIGLIIAFLSACSLRMIGFNFPSLPEILRPGMTIRQSIPSRPRKIILSQSTPWHSVILPEDTPASQFRNQQTDDVSERLRNARITKIGAIHIRNLYPAFQLIRHRRRITHHLGAISTQEEPLGNSLLIPRDPCRRCRGLMNHHTPYGRRRLLTEPKILLIRILTISLKSYQVDMI